MSEASEFLCVRCARHMKTCCQTSEVYITPGDAQRIAEQTGDREFYEFRAPDDPVYLKQDDDPIWPQLVFKRPDGTRRVLKRRENGDCRFLGERGCDLPLEKRPLICRIYPFDFNEQRIHPRLANGCPIELIPASEIQTAPEHGFGRVGETLLRELDMKQADAERWRRQLYAELPQELTADDYRTDL